jgi:hypothetical protein
VGKAAVSKRAFRRKALQRDSKVKSPDLTLFLRNKCRSDQERDTVRKKLQFWRESSVVPASAVGVSTPSPTSSSSASASVSSNYRNLQGYLGRVRPLSSLSHRDLRSQRACPQPLVERDRA